MRNVVGEGSVSIIVTGEHEVTSVLHLLSYLIELIPVSQLSLNFSRIICTQNFLSDVSSVSKQTGSCLPGNALEIAVRVSNDILGVLILVSQICIGETQILNRLYIRTIYILQSVVSLDQEHIDLVVRISLSLQIFVQLVLVSIISVRSCYPNDLSTVLQVLVLANLLSTVSSYGEAGLCLVILRIEVSESALELVVPCIDLQLFLGSFAALFVLRNVRDLFFLQIAYVAACASAFSAVVFLVAVLFVRAAGCEHCACHAQSHSTGH